MRYLSRAKKAALVVATVLFASVLTVGAPAAASQDDPASASGAAQRSAVVAQPTPPSTPAVDASGAPGIAAVAAGGTISGTITSGAETGGRFALLFEPNQSTGYNRWKQTTYGAWADAASGAYTMTGIPAGTYTVVFAAESDTIAPRYYGNTYNITEAKSFKVAKDGTVTGINGALEAGVTVSGTVTNGSGKAVGGALVRVARQITVDKKPFWEYDLDTTDAAGKYSVTGFAPGTIAVMAVGPSGQGYSEAFHGGGRSFETSKTFSLTSGASKGGVDIKLTKKLTVGTPKVSGTAAVGSTLKAKTGTWTKGTKFSYQWYADGKVIKKATKSSFALTKSQKGKKITVKVTGTNPTYATGVKTSKATAKVATVATPKISGTAKVGKKLTAKPGTWTKGTKFSYKWYANGKVIKKATKSSFTVTTSQKGKKITVKVTGKKSGFATVSKTSKASKKVS